LQAVEQRHGMLFCRTTGVAPVAQPEATIARSRQLLEALDPWRLAGLQPVVTISGSLVLALALLDGVLDAEQCFAASQLDEDWQAEQWGEDADAAALRASRRKDFMAAAEFLRLLKQQ
jgi:chaperone required for assembly of F1-ATPase